MNKEIVYIADLDQDIDDLFAILYLKRNNVLNCVVLDPYPKEKQGLERANLIKNLGIKIESNFPKDTKYVFCGGRLTLLNKFVKTNKIDFLCMNGGFVGCNLVKKPLKKFQNKETIRTFNFNMDVDATNEILKSSNIKEILLVGKNVCHNRINTKLGVWKNEPIFKDYDCSDTKLQHDMLACREGLIYLGMIKEQSFLNFLKVYPFNEGLDKTMTKWGSTLDSKKNEYKEVLAAIDWKNF